MKYMCRYKGEDGAWDWLQRNVGTLFIGMHESYNGRWGYDHEDNCVCFKNKEDYMEYVLRYG